MLRVTIELIPHGIEEATRQLACLSIANEGTGDGMRGDYSAVLTRDDSGPAVIRVYGYPREEGAVELVRRVLNALLGGE